MSSQRLHVPEAAEYLGISVIMLKRLYARGEGPPVIRINRRVIFDTRDLDIYLDEHKGIPPKPEDRKVEQLKSARAARGKPKRRRVSEVGQHPQVEA